MNKAYLILKFDNINRLSMLNVQLFNFHFHQLKNQSELYFQQYQYKQVLLQIIFQFLQCLGILNINFLNFENYPKLLLLIMQFQFLQVSITYSFGVIFQANDNQSIIQNFSYLNSYIYTFESYFINKSLIPQQPQDVVGQLIQIQIILQNYIRQQRYKLL
ncbi:unnamed protein product (macronuclear) [Paramecium tetraurelia]|uniref:Transmembrane protein n=1 Tax=Paramecium tetraurelia TaxID=5888 RepID=A0CC30_PARTE|nr:uncharacterized protein GSPATT00037131001 [Paramecium tetraurelia]CAK68347.1 unnamed protein product [Paramecium tetraurelia]|eukprot:XP_001435744.1 hypothetical protein (macronuclear) [Paramecium tetraurelia strain d4-2]